MPAFVTVAKSFSSLAGPPATATKPAFVGYPIIFFIFISTSRLASDRVTTVSMKGNSLLC